jgi:hypothetical protein
VRTSSANKHPEILNIAVGEEALCLNDITREKQPAVVPSRYGGAGFELLPSGFVRGTGSNVGRLAEVGLIINCQTVKYLTIMTTMMMMMMIMMTNLKASH